MLNLSAVSTIIEKPGTVFGIDFVDKHGTVVSMVNCVCTSSHFRPRTYNVMQLDSREIRKVRHISIVKINDEQTYY